MEGGRLPGAPEVRDERIICHVDMDCFYAACERLREPDLEGEPVVVGMGYEEGKEHGAVATASYEAREYGVESAQGIETAVERLPPMERAHDDPGIDPDDCGHYRPVDMEFYESVSEDVMDILRGISDTMREVSIDEAYLDVTESTDWAYVEGVARHLKQRIEREIGVTASVGIAPTMSAAKIASDHDKPDGLVVVEPGEVREFLSPLDVADLHGIGPVTAGELRKADIETIGDLAEAEESWLAERYGERGQELRRRARGEDDREVMPVGEPKSLSRESAFADSIDDVQRAHERIRTLAEAVADRARRKGALYQTIGIKVVEPPFEVNTRARSLPGPVDDPDLLERIALDLFSEFQGESIRKLGVRVSNLSFTAGDQASLDGWDTAGTDGHAGRPLDPDGVDGSDDDPDGQVTFEDFE